MCAVGSSMFEVTRAVKGNKGLWETLFTDININSTYFSDVSFNKRWYFFLDPEYVPYKTTYAVAMTVQCTSHVILH